MSQFIFDKDYEVLIRSEILDILVEDYSPTKLLRAEDMAIAQMKNYLKSRYDIEKIFDPGDLANQAGDFDSRDFAAGDFEVDVVTGTDTRNSHIVMLVVDCALYHLYSSLAPNKIPEHRSQRYGDALDWLKSAGRGEFTADLPLIQDDDGNDKTDIRIWSKYPPSNQRW